jgi:hypothetical protein
MALETGGVDPHILKAIAKAWSWRRKLESGAVATMSDIAEAEGVTPPLRRSDAQARLSGANRAGKAADRAHCAEGA